MKSGTRSGYGAGRPANIAPTRTGGSFEPDNGPERIAALARLVENLSEQIDAIEGANRRTAIQRSVKQAAEQKQAEPVRSMAPPRIEPLARPAVDPQAERLKGIEKRLAALAEQITHGARPAEIERPAPAEPEGLSTLQSAIAEISARQRAIDLENGRALSPVDSIALEDAITALRADIAAIDRRIVQEARRGEEIGQTLRNEFAERLDRLPAIQLQEQGALAQVRHDLAEIRQAIDLAARESTLASIETGYGHVIERLDDIVRRVPERDRIDGIAQEISRLAAKLDRAPLVHPVDGEIDDIRNAIASLAANRSAESTDSQIAGLRMTIEAMMASTQNSGDLSRIEDRLDALLGRFDGSQDRHFSDLQQSVERLAARSGERIDLSRIEHELDGLHREIDGVARSLDPTVLLRLEQQLSAIRSALDHPAPTPSGLDNKALSRLEQRLDALAGRFDAIAELPNLVTPASAEAVAGLRSELVQWREEMFAREPLRSDAIEAQMRGLVERLDAVASRDDSQSLAQLEAQVEALAEKFSAAAPDTAALGKVEQSLDQLQALLGETRRETIDAAREAARSTFQEFTGSLPAGPNSDLVAALRDDLRNLQQAAHHSDRQNQDTLEAVHDTLAKVVDRIAQLEADELRGVDMSWSQGRTSRATLPEDHRPLPPGSGRPDLSAIRPAIGPENLSRPGDRKADFIAAARRAAQSAQIETSKARTEEAAADQPEPRPGRLARIGQALRSRRLPIVLAIAAVVLAIGALQFGPEIRERITDAREPVASLDTAPTASIAARPARDVTPAAQAMPAPALDTAATTLVAPNPDGGSLAFQPADAAADYLASAPQAPAASRFAAAAEPAKPAAPTAMTLDVPALQKAAESGDPIAAFEVAKHFAEGVGSKPDAKVAAQWYERAAKAGLAIAQYRIGSLYERGEGVKRDTAAAQAWYQKASLQGNARATHNLAVLLSEGANGKADLQRAAQLFTAASNLNVADSQYNLGVLYARGLGVTIDLAQSYKWFALAALQGDVDAGKRRDEVEKAMTPGEIAAARAAVQAFQPIPLNAAANDEPLPSAEWMRPATETSQNDTIAPSDAKI